MSHATTKALACRPPVVGPTTTEARLYRHISQQLSKTNDRVGVERLFRAFTASALVLSACTANPSYAMEGIKIEPGINASEQYFQTVPQGLDTEDASGQGNKSQVKLSTYLEGPRGKEIQQCARRCTSTCIRGGQGAPGIGPMALRKEVVVFKPGYRSGKYCLNECIQICALQINGSK